MNRILAMLFFVFLLMNSFVTNAAPRELSFPLAHGQHSDAELEWWSFFGHLIDSNNRLFGFTLNFIRVSAPPQHPPSLWTTSDIYTSYFTITDGDDEHFYIQEKENRTSFNFAGASNEQLWIWNRNWGALLKDSILYLQAATTAASLKLQLTSTKPPLLFGENGFYESLNFYHYALSHLQGEGELRLGAHNYHIVSIKGGMDHAFQLKKNRDMLWDKFVIHLTNGDDIYIYIFSSQTSIFVSPESFGVISYADGHTVFLKMADFQFTRLNSWYSDGSKLNYPSGWRLIIPRAHYRLEIEPVLKNQEVITMDNTYWQGQCLVSGDIDNSDVKGYAYVELSKKANRNYIL